MIVRVRSAAFDSSAGSPCELLDIVHLCAVERHALVFEPGARDAAIRWCHQLGGRMAMIARDELEVARRYGAKVCQRGRTRAEVHLDDVPEDDWTRSPPTLGLRTAWCYLHEPLRLIVENVRSDGAFIRAMLFGDDGEFLRRALHDGRIALTHGGGLGDVRRFVEATIDDPSVGLRTVVMFDHDGYVPTVRSKPSSDLMALCAEKAVAHHPLQRRAIENYIPLKALRRWVAEQPIGKQPSLTERIDALAGLEPDLRRHFNMKSGLCGDMGETLPAPFDAISDPLLEPLARGFGEKIAVGVFGNPNRPIQESWIRSDGSAEELQRLADILIARL